MVQSLQSWQWLKKIDLRLIPKCLPYGFL